MDFKAYDRQAVRKKYDGIDERGTEKVLKGLVEEFDWDKSFPEGKKLHQRFSVFSLYEDIRPLEWLLDIIGAAIEKSFGAKLILAGREVPAHSTILEGLYKDPFPGISVAGNHDFIGCSQANLEELSKCLLGERFVFNRLLLDGGNLLLAAEDIPKNVPEARAKLEKIYTDAGLEPLPMSDIWHLTISRLAKIPKEMSGRWQEYQEYIVYLQKEVRSYPISLTIEGFRAGSAKSFLVKE